MSDVCLVTALVDEQLLAWGLRPARIHPSMLVLCPPALATRLREADAPPSVRFAAAEPPWPLSTRDRFELLHRACEMSGRGRDRRGNPERVPAALFWVDVEILYGQLSFEFLYSDLLAAALRRVGTAPVFLEVPGCVPASFFGGPREVVCDALATRPSDAETLFATTRGVQHPGQLFRPAFDTPGAEDLNLILARLIESPIVHVIGDSHVFNCFTPTEMIGLRANVLMRAGEVSPIPIPYAYQLTHHLGSRTLHHAGIPGELVSVARQCAVKPGDAVVWVFGEIDVRCHILNQQEDGGRPLEEIVETLTRNFVGAMLDVGARLGPVRQIVFAPIPPLDNPHYRSVDLPVHGSIDDRIEARRRLCAFLAARCQPHGIPVLEVGDEFRTGRGDLPWELSDHFCHVGSRHQGPIIAQLYRLLAA